MYLCTAPSASETPRRPDTRTRYETAVAAESADADDDGSDVVLVALEEASRAVDAALNATVQRLFTPSTASKGYGFLCPTPCGFMSSIALMIF